MYNTNSIYRQRLRDIALGRLRLKVIGHRWEVRLLKFRVRFIVKWRCTFVLYLVIGEIDLGGGECLQPRKDITYICNS